jgi:hypothetical protein
MVLDTKKPQGAPNAARYKESLRDGREVWLDGEIVKDATTHPAFASIIDELARIYELQHTDEYRDQMTFVSPDIGVRCSISYLLPRNLEDLKKKRRNSEIGNQQAWGQFRRGPDLLPQFVLGMYNNREALSAVKNPHCPVLTAHGGVATTDWWFRRCNAAQRKGPGQRRPSAVLGQVHARQGCWRRVQVPIVSLGP